MEYSFDTKNLDTFKEIADTMRWKASALNQIERFWELTSTLGLHAEVVGSHTSKSIRLPVICITGANGVKVYLRDNFMDVNVCVVADRPITIPTATMFEGVITPLDWDWYLAQIARCRGYSWREWSDEQMADPGLLSVTTGDHMWTIEAGEKERWTRRLEDPSWYTLDWSTDGLVWEGEFGPGVALYRQAHPFMQGIRGLVRAEYASPYKPGCQGFALALPTMELVAVLLARVLGIGIPAAQPSVSEQIRDEYDSDHPHGTITHYQCIIKGYREYIRGTADGHGIAGVGSARHVSYNLGIAWAKEDILAQTATGPGEL